MTLGEAIVAAHQRGDAAERNRLLAIANDHATLRTLAALLGVCLNTAHRWTIDGKTQTRCNRLDSAAPEHTLVDTDKLAPATRERPGAVAPRSTP